MSDYVYAVQISVPPEIETRFNELYDSEHIPAILRVEGVRSCTRYRLEWADGGDMPEYLALYEVDDPELPRSEAWKHHANSGSWPTEIRPHMTVRRHGMFRRTPPDGGETNG